VTGEPYIGLVQLIRQRGDERYQLGFRLPPEVDDSFLQKMQQYAEVYLEHEVRDGLESCGKVLDCRICQHDGRRWCSQKVVAECAEDFSWPEDAEEEDD